MYYTNSRVLFKISTKAFLRGGFMRYRFLLFTIIMAIMLSLLTSPAMAAKVVDISRPDGNEVVTKDTFTIFGTCVYDETTISFEYKDKDSGEFKPLETTDGYSTFKVGSGKMFGKDIKLKYKGPNEIKIIAYTKDTVNDKWSKTYTITLGEEQKKSNWFDKAIEWITGGSKDSDKDSKEKDKKE